MPNNACQTLPRHLPIRQPMSTAKASENGLAELPDKTVATVLPTTGVTLQ